MLKSMLLAALLAAPLTSFAHGTGINIEDDSGPHPGMSVSQLKDFYQLTDGRIKQSEEGWTKVHESEHGNTTLYMSRTYYDSDDDTYNVYAKYDMKGIDMKIIDLKFVSSDDCEKGRGTLKSGGFLSNAGIMDKTDDTPFDFRVNNVNAAIADWICKPPHSSNPLLEE